MSTPGHRWIGIAFAFLAALVARHVGLSPLADFIAGMSAFWGSTAPDWLEIAKAVRRRHLFGLFAPDTWKRQSVIPHRTITHWVVLWAALLLYASFTLSTHPVYIHAVLFGFALGGTGHLLCDWPNPTGIPFLTPFPGSRKSLHLWQSGDRREWMVVILFWAFTVALWAVPASLP